MTVFGDGEGITPRPPGGGLPGGGAVDGDVASGVASALEEEPMLPLGGDQSAPRKQGLRP